MMKSLIYNYFFFNDTATTEIYTLSLHDALPIFAIIVMPSCFGTSGFVRTVAKPMPETCAPDVHTFWPFTSQPPSTDRKSTRLNSSHANISYAVFCLKKKTTTKQLYYHFHSPLSL